MLKIRLEDILKNKIILILTILYTYQPQAHDYPKIICINNFNL